MLKEIIILIIAAMLSGLVIEIYSTYKDWPQIKHIGNKVRYILMGWISASLLCQAIILFYVLIRIVLKGIF